MNENLCSFLLQAQKKFTQNNSSCLFQEFLDECEQACRGVHDREFEPTEASEISRPSVSDGSDNNNVCGRNATETSRLSLSGILEFEADEDLVPRNLPEMDWDVDFANIKNVIGEAGVGLNDHGQSSYAPNSDAQDQDQVKEMLQWFREAIPNLTDAGLIQYQMA